jgi:hypothetical protein
MGASLWVGKFAVLDGLIRVRIVVGVLFIYRSMRLGLLTFSKTDRVAKTLLYKQAMTCIKQAMSPKEHFVFVENMLLQWRRYLDR